LAFQPFLASFKVCLGACKLNPLASKRDLCLKALLPALVLGLLSYANILCSVAQRFTEAASLSWRKEALSHGQQCRVKHPLSVVK
jgi:hypothetical protein